MSYRAFVERFKWKSYVESKLSQRGGRLRPVFFEIAELSGRDLTRRGVRIFRKLDV
jgi:hypothetical protein